MEVLEMKRLCLSLIGLVAFTGAAAAADLSRPAPAPYYKAPIAAPVYNWTGLYFGITGGGAFGTSSWDLTGSRDTSGGLVGGTIGYNWQSAQTVFGLEGDLDWADINGTSSTNCPGGCKTSDSWLSTVRGRLGYAADRFMPYVTGGAAFGDIRASTPGFGTYSTDRAGWTLGAGRQLDRQGRISLCRSRQHQLRPQLRRRARHRQRLVPHQPAAGWRELQ